VLGLIATARANSPEPHAWLTDMFRRLPTTRNRDIDSPLSLVEIRASSIPLTLRLVW